MHEDDEGNTPLMGAARVGQVGIIQMLLKEGCPPDVQNVYGQNACDIASKYGKADCIRLIRRKMTGVVPPPRRGPEGAALEWCDWEDVAEAKEQARKDEEKARYVAKQVRESARREMSPEQAAMDRAQEEEEDRVRRVKLFKEAEAERTGQPLAADSMGKALTVNKARAGFVDMLHDGGAGAAYDPHK
jgi:hypothetical protein